MEHAARIAAMVTEVWTANKALVTKTAAMKLEVATLTKL